MDVPFLTLHTLGHGSIGHVDCIVHEAGGDGVPTAELARKVVHLRGSHRRHLLSILKEEVAVTKSLVHQHIVQITGTYETITVPRQFGIIMFPAGDEDLSHFLEEVPERNFPLQDIQRLERWLLCLASALDYVHSQGIRHKDIKPQNIICQGNDILITDFGSAHQFTETSSTTQGHAGRVTYMYGAPEVLSQGRRGRAADIFSLGCVFSEMATVITGRRNKDFYDHRAMQKADFSAETTHMFCMNQDRIKSWFQNCSWPEVYELLSIMLSQDPSHRPRAFEVVATLVAATTHPICECVHGPILLPKNWDLAIQFELLPGMVEHPSPGSTYGLPLPNPQELLETSIYKAREARSSSTRHEARAPRRSPVPVIQIGRDDGFQTPDSLLTSLLALVEDPGNSDLQSRYSAAEAISLPQGLNSRRQDGRGPRVLVEIAPLVAPRRPRRDFSSAEPLVIERLRGEEIAPADI